MVYTLINKEARFLFAETPDLKVESSGNRDSVSEEVKNQIDILNRLLKKVFDSNNFDDSLLKAAKDCFKQDKKILYKALQQIVKRSNKPGF